MADSSFSVTITATAPTPEQAHALRLAGLQRFVRTTYNGTDPIHPTMMNEAELLPLAEAALQAFVRDCIVADVARDAEGVRAGIIAQGEAQAQALSVQAEVLP